MAQAMGVTMETIAGVTAVTTAIAPLISMTTTQEK
jgi:hypothetical protein